MAANPASMDMVIIARVRTFLLFLLGAGGSCSGGYSLGGDTGVSALSAIIGIGGRGGCSSSSISG